MNVLNLQSAQEEGGNVLMESASSSILPSECYSFIRPLSLLGSLQWTKGYKFQIQKAVMFETKIPMGVEGFKFESLLQMHHWNVYMMKTKLGILGIPWYEKQSTFEMHTVASGSWEYSLECDLLSERFCRISSFVGKVEIFQITMHSFQVEPSPG